jgi:hypothetical protein
MAEQDSDKQQKVTLKFDPKTKEISVNKIPEWAGFKKQR